MILTPQLDSSAAAGARAAAAAAAMATVAGVAGVTLWRRGCGWFFWSSTAVCSKILARIFQVALSAQEENLFYDV